MKTQLRTSLILLACFILLWLPHLARADENAWTTNSLVFLDVGVVVIDPLESHRLYAVSDDFIYQSVDGGGTWRVHTRYDLSRPVPEQFAIDPLTPDIFYAVSGG